MTQKTDTVSGEVFDRLVERRSTDSLKWGTYEEDVLPMWVADMDFPAPEPVIRAMQERVNHGVYGYGMHPPALVDAILERLERLYRWKVSREAVTFVPGTVPGFNLAVRSQARPGGEVLIQTPVYPPFLRVAANSGMAQRVQQLAQRQDGFYEVDLDAFETAVSSKTAAFLLCNPHNPVGRVFRADELTRMAEICLHHRVAMISDEIHCDLIFQGHRHIPLASLSAEVEQHTITLMAPSKTFNIAGLECAIAVIPNSELRRRFETSRAGLVPGVNVLGCVAALAAYREGQAWLDALLKYLEANRDFVLEFAKSHLPGVTVVQPEGTFLAWLDCRKASLPANPAKYFLQEARVALNDGRKFGPGGEGFVRLNFGCPRMLLKEGLERMATALARRSGA